MEYNSIFARSFGQYERKKFGYGAFLGCWIIALSFFAMFKPSIHLLPICKPFHHVTLLVHLRFCTSVGFVNCEVIRSEKKPEFRYVCSLWQPRSDFCEIYGDIRIYGNSSKVFFVKPQMGTTAGNESWRIRPYARKEDQTAMSTVQEFSVQPLAGREEDPLCTLNHSIPSIVFSTGGYAGNHFHDFSDLLIPLFITAREFNGEVQFLVTNARKFWIEKYKLILKQLSNYEIIDIDRDNGIHCFPKMIIGLKYHKDFGIDPTKSRNGYSAEDFKKFLRNSFKLKRAIATIGDRRRNKKPRLLIISRKKTRAFANIGEIVKMAKSLGYKVKVADPSLNMSSMARMVNFCDVMMGVHGAGLTNLVFLPTNAILIQIVPVGLQWLSTHYFREPSLDMNIRYSEYKIKEEESTLIEEYPLDHAVFRDPSSFQTQGWDVFESIFLKKQNVKLDVGRFRETLIEALKVLHD
ncbi:hypothetical protein GIB67_032051 [Kingdonia uniflora]|uniref:Glycosyltransferase 61 catalytic domain-containing protein n=1 Tax=Kingdonia uniflora TaxID=39325 RepID=A0A7J7MWY3_9MAGN|nr:hypothetical protein GIB67_032051 [Kingdonia uniflora]